MGDPSGVRDRRLAVVSLARAVDSGRSEAPGHSVRGHDPGRHAAAMVRTWAAASLTVVLQRHLISPLIQLWLGRPGLRGRPLYRHDPSRAARGRRHDGSTPGGFRPSIRSPVILMDILPVLPAPGGSGAQPDLPRRTA